MRKIYSVLIVISLWSVSACQEQKPQKFAEDTMEVNETMPTQTSMKPVVYFVDSNITKAILRAGRARVYDDRKVTFLNDSMEVDFFDTKTQLRTSRLTATSGMIEEETKNMTARGNVVVVGDSSNTTLTTEVLMWSEERKKLYSTEFVRIESPTEILEGYGFESDQQLKNYTIFKPSGVRYPDK